MSPTQVSAAQILLRKTLPDLQAVQLQGDEDNPLRFHNKVELVIVDPKA